MAAYNTINILKWWYPEGIDMTVDHDVCDIPTGRYDMVAHMPPCEGTECATKRTPLQRWVNVRNIVQKYRMKLVWRQEGFKNFDDYDINGILLLVSMKYLGSDQFLYDRADIWDCFWKGIQLASVGWNDPKTVMTLESSNSFLKGLGASTWPPNPLLPENNCEVPFTYPKIGMAVEVWMFQRVFTPSLGSDRTGALFAGGNKAVAKTWAACRFWYDTHTFGNAQTIPFGKETPAMQIAKNYPQYFPGGMPEFPNPYQGFIDVENKNGKGWEMPFLREPATNSDGGFNASGLIIVPPESGAKIPGTVGYNFGDKREEVFSSLDPTLENTASENIYEKISNSKLGPSK